MTTLILAAEESHNPLLPEWSEIILSLIVFLALVFVVQRFVAPRFEQAYRERTERIEGGLKEAERKQAEAQEALEQYQRQLADARHEASRIREEAREQGASIVAEMRQQAQAEADRIVASARTQVEADRQQALVQLRAEIGELATQLASRIVGESLEDEARQRRVVERFLAELEEQSPAGQGR